MVTPADVATPTGAAARSALWSLAAGLLLAAAVAAVGGLVYSESGTTCQSLLFRSAQRLLAVGGDCEPYWNARVLLVALLVVAALACAVRGGQLALRGRRQPAGGDGAEGRPVGPRPAAALDLVVLAWAVPASAALLALAYVPVAVLAYAPVGGYEGYFDSPRGLPGGWLHLTYAVGGMASCRLMRRAGLVPRSTLAAVAVAVPVIVLANAVLSAVLAPPETGLPDLHARPATMALAALLFALALAVAARLQAVGRAMPPAAHSVAALLLGLWLVTPVLVESFRPDYDPFGGGPGNGHLEAAIWVPLLAAPGVAPALLVARSARHSEPSRRSPVTSSLPHPHDDRQVPLHAAG